jgi:peptidoglycan/LPS O-acetylase OafA/YrhL
MRALAMTLVFLMHKTNIRSKLSVDVGVTLFFVLSGYLITSILIKRRALIESGLTTVRYENGLFFVNRAFRIFPAYYAMLAILSVITLTIAPVITLKWLPLYATYTTNLGIEFISKSFPSLGHLWSLAVEEQFYLIAAPLFLSTAITNAKYIVAGLIAAGVLSFAILFAEHASDVSIAADSFISFSNLGVGSALALAVTTSNGKGSAAVVAGIIGMIVVINIPSFLHLDGNSLGTAILMQLPVVFGAITIRATLINQDSLVVRLLEWAPVRLLGRISYAFYLWHISVDFNFLEPALHAWMPDGARVMIVVCEYGCAVLIAVASWWLLEAPMLRCRDRLLSRKFSPQPSPTDQGIPLGIR